MDNVPYDVIDNYDVADLTDVKQEQSILPVTKGLKVRIAKASTQMNKAKDIYSLKLELRIVDGIVNDEGVAQYVNKPIFTGIMDLVYGAKDSATRDNEGKHWWKTNQHLVEFKNFCKALDINLSGIKVNDEFVANLIGKEVLVDVTHEAQTNMDPSTGERTKTGEFREKLKNWRKA